MRFLALLATLAALGSSAASAQSEPQREIVAGALRSWPPQYSLDEAGEPTGFAIDIMNEVARRANLRVRYRVFDSFPEMKAALDAGEIDVIPNYGDIEERHGEAAFTPPVETLVIALFVRADTPNVDGLDDLRGHRVAVVRSNAAVSMLAAHGAVEVTYEDVSTALFDLLAGRVDALAYPASVLEALAREAGVTEHIRRVGPPLTEVKRAIAVRPEDRDLLARLTAAVDSLVRSTTYREIYSRWYGQEPPFWTVVRVAWTTGIALAALLVAVAFWRMRVLGRHNRELRSRIAERDAAQAALVTSEAEYRRIVETSVEGVWVIDGDGLTTFVNPRMAEMLGSTPGDMLGRSMFEFFDEALAEEARQNFERRREGVEELHYFRLRHADGSEREVLMSASPIFEDGEFRGALAMVSDVTARRQLEARVEKGQRLEALGRLAGGVAHDFNNLIFVINASVGLAREELAADHPAADDLAQIEEAAERARSLTAQLLAFSRRQVTSTQTLSPAARIAEVTPLLRRLLSEDIELLLPESPTDSCVAIDPVHLDQVVFNLVSNAGDAIVDGGRISISVEDVTLEGDEVPAGDYVEITVEDDGTGMSPEVVTSIFEPFFTTKSDGRGTGLGLATCYGLVTQAGGKIRVESKVGEGSRFHVLLPRVSGAADAPAVPEARADAEPERPLTVLLVEDDEAVRRGVSRLLSRGGHQVLEAESPEHALQICGDRGEELDLLLTDIVMPGMNGRELGRRVRLQLPALRIVYMSGHTDRALRDLEELGERETFLAKPFSEKELRRAIAAETTATPPA